MSEALRLVLDPPLRQLLMLQIRAKVRRGWKRLRSPRRAVTVSLVIFLLIMYVVQVYIALAYGQPQQPVDIRAVAPLGMVGILMLKLLAVCIDRNKSGAGFRREETYRLLGGPFPHEQVRLYRTAGHAISILFTALFAAVFFRFHVASFWGALCGSYMAMMFTYLVHTSIAVAAVHADVTSYRWVRNSACLSLLAFAGWICWRAAESGATNLQFLMSVQDELTRVFSTTVGKGLLAPFHTFTEIIVTDDLGTGLSWTLLGLIQCYLALQFLLWSEVAWVGRSWRREWRTTNTDARVVTRDSIAQASLIEKGLGRSLPFWLAGTGPLIWRQLKAVKRVKGGLGWLILPATAAFACETYWAFDPKQGAIQSIAVVIVLTSTFLPGLLPFDFRGDLRGLVALKGMPLVSRAVVVGQLAVPVTMLSLIQLTALSTLILHDMELAGTVCLTMLFLIPTNFIIMALENLIFLLYPYRLTDFDMQATIRRIVMLMTKFCVLFMAAILSLFVGFGILMLRIGLSHFSGVLNDGLRSIQFPLMVSLQLLALATVALWTVNVTSWAYHRFDVSEDLPL